MPFERGGGRVRREGTTRFHGEKFRKKERKKEIENRRKKKEKKRFKEYSA